MRLISRIRSILLAGVALGRLATGADAEIVSPGSGAPITPIIIRGGGDAGGAVDCNKNGEAYEANQSFSDGTALDSDAYGLGREFSASLKREFRRARPKSARAFPAESALTNEPLGAPALGMPPR